MLRFSLASFFVLPVALGYFDLTVVRPVVAAIVLGVVAVVWVGYGLMAEQTETYLDVRSKIGFQFLGMCLMACALICVVVKVGDRASDNFSRWAYEYRMSRLGYEKVYDAPTLGTNGQVLARGYRWKKSG
ncbi:hypothetical protein LOC71_00285 [Rhodopirellula sp. JC740]|uniref:Uncharacterized protein n=1 Tax=Rhodopirellula halodulae TaxID=2894198 RepID=A0ABS8NAW0_9BACT|nr:hypothetical protein [Rhodopirellula sp. JC740]MCC9640694.1 hypothetical protein [Rhodopirellula sp. JC740]